jgi:glycine cleavage system H lipoate-binding protein
MRSKVKDVYAPLTGEDLQMNREITEIWSGFSRD